MRFFLPLCIAGLAAAAPARLDRRDDRTVNPALVLQADNFVTLLNVKPASEDFRKEVEKYVPKAVEPKGTDPSRWPYDTAEEQKVKPVILGPVLAPDADTGDVDGLKPASKHLLFFADVEEEVDANGERSISAALLTTMQEGKKVVNLGATDQVIDVTCGGNSLTMHFVNEESARRAARYIIVPEGDLIFMDAYGKNCGKANEFQFFQQTKVATAPKSTDKTITFQIREVKEQFVLEEFRGAWGPESSAAIEENNKSDSNENGVTATKRSAYKDDLDRAFEGKWAKKGRVPKIGQAAHKRMKAKRGFFSGVKEWQEEYSIERKLGGDKTPWGDGKNLWKDDSLHVACVGCGLNGKLLVSGAVEWSVKKILSGGIVKANAIMSLTSSVKVQIGIDTKADQKHMSANFNKSLKELAGELKLRQDIPLSPITLGSVLILGPSVSIEPFIKAGVKSTGQILMGAEASLDDAEVHVNLMAEKKVQTARWAPKIKPILKLNAEVESELVAGVRLGIDLGLVVVNKKRGVSLINEPSFFGRAKATVGEVMKAPGLKPLNPKPVDPSKDWKMQAPAISANCDGVAFECGVGHKLYFEMDLWKPKQYTILKPELFKSEYCWPKAEINDWLNQAAPTCIAASNESTGSKFTASTCFNYDTLKNLKEQLVKPINNPLQTLKSIKQTGKNGAIAAKGQDLGGKGGKGVPSSFNDDDFSDAASFSTDATNDIGLDDELEDFRNPRNMPSMIDVGA